MFPHENISLLFSPRVQEKIKMRLLTSSLCITQNVNKLRPGLNKQSEQRRLLRESQNIYFFSEKIIFSQIWGLPDPFHSSIPELAASWGIRTCIKISHRPSFYKSVTWKLNKSRYFQHSILEMLCVAVRLIFPARHKLSLMLAY